MSKLLIVDDEVATVEMLSIYMRINGHEPLGAYGGGDGLVLAKVEQPDLMILDLMMPDMDGFEVCKRVRAHEELSKLPIIIISARTDQSAIDRAMGAGANAYLTKPINLLQLNTEIKRLLPEDNS